MKKKLKSDNNLLDNLEKVKSTIEYAAQPIVGIASIWGVDIAGITAATQTFLISAIAYAEYIIKAKK